MYFVRERAFVNELVKGFNNYFKRYQNVSFFSLQNVGSISFSYKISENPFRNLQGIFFSHGNELSWTKYRNFPQDKRSCIYLKNQIFFLNNYAELNVNLGISLFLKN